MIEKIKNFAAIIKTNISQNKKAVYSLFFGIALIGSLFASYYI